MHSVCYVVEERNRAGGIRSRFYTPNSWQALSEWLLKLHKPLGFPPGIAVTDQEMDVQTQGSNVPLTNLILDLKGQFTWKGSPVRSVSIRTELAATPFVQFYASETARIYQTNSYMSSVTHLKNKIKSYSGGEIDVCYALANIAAKNPLHPLWERGG